MGRLLFWIVLIGVAWFALRSAARQRNRPGRPTGAPVAAPTSLAPPQSMRPCATCGVFIPEAEAVRDADGRLFCCEAHRAAAPHDH